MNINRRKLLSGAAWLTASALTSVARAAAGRREEPALHDLGVVAVAEVVSGDILRLADGREARLAGIEAAAPPSGAEPGRRWPLAEAAKTALSQAVAGRELRLWTENPAPDRHGRLTVHLQRADDGAWLQELLLAGGHARVRPAPGDDARAFALLMIEETARRDGRGIWATRVYAVRPAGEVEILLRDAGLLTVVEGKPTAAQRRDGKIYLDFGDDWRRDFTAVVGSATARALKRDGVDVAALAGRRVRVRGWPERRFGPQIEISVPAQLEVLD